MTKKDKNKKVQPVEKKLYGIVEKVVESVRDGSIDINRVFTREYASQFGDLEDHDVLVSFSQNWYDSLPYINSVHPDNMTKEFGVLRLAEEDFEVNGAEVACYVIKNIFADFMMTGDMFMHPLCNPAGIIPHVLCDPDDLWRGEEDFMYFPGENQEEIHFCARSNHKMQDLNLTTIEQGVDLLQLFEVIQPNSFEIEGEEYVECDENGEDIEPTIEPLGIYGFMASLIHVMFKDAVRRRIFNADWYDDNWANTVIYTVGFIKFVNHEDLPLRLHIPAKMLFSEYLDKTLLILQGYLYIEDIEYEDDLGYTMRRMLEIEIEQYKKQQSSKLWKALPEKVQEMLLKYHLLFIKFMQKNLSMEEVGIPEEKEAAVAHNIEEQSNLNQTEQQSAEVHYHFYAPVGQVVGKADNVNMNNTNNHE